jgi:hypothetical protein
MAHINKKYCTAKNEGGQTFIYLPDGQRLPAVIMTRVTDEVNKKAVALVKMYVNIE